MRDSRRSILLVLGLAGAVLALVLAGVRAAPPAASSAGYARYRADAATAKRDGVPVLPAATRAASFRFAAGTAPADRDAVLSSIARARPEARRLVALVDGLVDVRIGSTGVSGAIGLTRPGARYAVTLDLGPVARATASAASTVSSSTSSATSSTSRCCPTTRWPRCTPASRPATAATQGVSGACANGHERFAESFAKWATGDIGVDLGTGYKVPPPGPTLGRLGRPARAPRRAVGQLDPGR